LNCGSLCPFGGKLINRSPALLVCHCLLIETHQGLVLVDTGFGLKEVTDFRRYIAPGFKQMLRPKLLESETAIRQVEKLGFKASDVRHIVLSDLDLDHAGGLSDFPHAKVHLMAAEKEIALSPRTLHQKLRYQASQWAHQPQWVTYQPRGENWFGFQAVHELVGL